MNDCDEIIAPPNQLFCLPNSPPTDLKLRFTFFQNYQKPSPLSKYFQECNENVNKTETMAKKNTCFAGDI